MKWFKHDTGAHDNNKLTKVRMRYGAEGYAVYWYCLELIAGDLGVSEEINFELKHDAEVIGFNLKVDSLKVEEIMRYMVGLNLFEDVEGKITCIRIAKYLDKKTTRNKRIHDIIDASKGLDCPETSPTVGDSPPTTLDLSPDCPDMSPLDTDTDIDIKESREYAFALKMFEKISDLYPDDKKPKEPNFTKWAQTIERTCRLDNRTIEDLWRVFEWANKDSFWSTNILSPEKLRKQYDKLLLAKGAEQSGSNSANEPPQGPSGRAF